jgi:5-formyltetrahydrofolate cyclo-ligase
MHELDPSYVGLPAGVETSAPSPSSTRPDWPIVREWRKETRANLLQRRMKISAQDRADWSDRISLKLEAALLEALVGSTQGKKLIGFYWPFRGEYDARPVLTRLHSDGTRLALPVVVEKAQPLQFREWWPGISMTRGIWNIPIPASGEAVLPDVLVAPLVGFDLRNYRLGYGGGFYDRTIASLPIPPTIIGVGFELARLDTIYPQVHDIPMTIIITEAGVER